MWKSIRKYNDQYSLLAQEFSQQFPEPSDPRKGTQVGMKIRKSVDSSKARQKYTA